MDKSKEDKNQLLEFDDKKKFMEQLLITEKAKKSIIKPKITAKDTGINLNLIDNIKSFLDETKNGENQANIEEDNLNASKESNNEIGVEFNLLMYKEDSGESSGSEEDDN